MQTHYGAEGNDNKLQLEIKTLLLQKHAHRKPNSSGTDYSFMASNLMECEIPSSYSLEKETRSNRNFICSAWAVKSWTPTCQGHPGGRGETCSGHWDVGTGVGHKTEIFEQLIMRDCIPESWQLCPSSDFLKLYLEVRGYSNSLSSTLYPVHGNVSMFTRSQRRCMAINSQVWFPSRSSGSLSVEPLNELGCEGGDGRGDCGLSVSFSPEYECVPLWCNIYSSKSCPLDTYVIKVCKASCICVFWAQTFSSGWATHTWMESKWVVLSFVWPKASKPWTYRSECVDQWHSSCSQMWSLL